MRSMKQKLEKNRHFIPEEPLSTRKPSRIWNNRRVVEKIWNKLRDPVWFLVRGRTALWIQHVVRESIKELGL